MSGVDLSPSEEVQATLTPNCSPVAVSELLRGPRRLDAEVYLSDGYIVRKAIREADTERVLLGDVARVWQPTRLKAIQVEEEDGVPFLAATQVFDIWPTPRKWLAPSKTPDLADRYVKPGWILITRSGTVGNTIMAYSAHNGVVVSDDLLRAQVEDPVRRHYLYAFLRTWHGRSMMRASHYGNVIKHLEVEHLEGIPVPMLAHMRAEVDAAIGQVFTKRDRAYQLDKQARERLEAALPETPEPPPEVGFTVKASAIFSERRRLDGYAHNPEYLAVDRALARSDLAMVALGDLAQLTLPSRFTRNYVERGTPLFGSQNVFQINPEVEKFLAPSMKIDLDEYSVRPGWILMARSGQIYGINGSVVLATEAHAAGVVSEHVIRVIPNDQVRPGYLQAFLSHPTLGQPLVLSRAFGTSVPELAPEDIAGLPVPRLASELEDEIADAVEEASRLRMEADQEENGIVARLEDEIEKSVGRPKKLRPDANEIAYRVMMEATGQAPRTKPPHMRSEAERNKEAVERGEKGGRPKKKGTG